MDETEIREIAYGVWLARGGGQQDPKYNWTIAEFICGYSETSRPGLIAKIPNWKLSMYHLSYELRRYLLICESAYYMGLNSPNNTGEENQRFAEDQLRRTNDYLFWKK